jgi:ergothioneine biosynthesis protein EgtB
MASVARETGSIPSPGAGPEHAPELLARRYREVRRQTRSLCEPLGPEDCVVQSMPDASPTKWHLAHTTWFFETFVLSNAAPGYRPFHPDYAFLFNSYYNAIGDRIARPSRGLITRPTLREVYDYRDAIDDRVLDFLTQADGDQLRRVGDTLILGLHHEQQHQELILTDIKHAFGCNPLRPAYRAAESAEAGTAAPVHWHEYSAGLRSIGHDGFGFAFDNEGPRHRQFVEGFRLASRLVTNGEYLAFMDDGGYARPELWLSDGWDARRTQGWTAPLYWERAEDDWRAFTLAGMRPIDPAEPVTHVSFYEADAFARWAGARLPTEAEWEIAASEVSISGNFVEGDLLRPAPAVASDGESAPAQLFGDTWEWMSSPYTPYPGYRPAPGALGEYNGKFMCNQMVLRGGSCATPRLHIRASYRNFFPPGARWQFTGIRLAQDP